MNAWLGVSSITNLAAPSSARITLRLWTLRGERRDLRQSYGKGTVTTAYYKVKLLFLAPKNSLKVTKKKLVFFIHGSFFYYYWHLFSCGWGYIKWRLPVKASLSHVYCLKAMFVAGWLVWPINCPFEVIKFGWLFLCWAKPAVQSKWPQDNNRTWGAQK